MARKTTITGEAVRDDSLTGDDIDESTLVLNQIRDADGDTKIQVEESADEDKIRFDTAGNERMVVDGFGNIGIGTIDPKSILDVHMPAAYFSNLGNDVGGGLVVKFGSGTLTAGKLYYLHTDGTWTETDADAIASGADQMLGIALGSSATSDGILLRGFFDAHSYMSNFSAGKAIYASTTAGGMDTVAPSSAGDYVRIIGYCTLNSNVIYFNPSSTWIEL